VAQGRPLQLLRRGKEKVVKTDEAEAEAEADEAVAEAESDSDQKQEEEDEEGDASKTGTEDADATEEDGLFKVVADAAVKQLHMVMLNLPLGPGKVPFVKVNEVDKGEWADKQGIVPGAEIVTINGKVAKDLTMQDFIALLKARPVTLMMKPPPEEPTQQPPAAQPPIAAQQGAVAPFGAAAAPAVAPTTTAAPIIPTAAPPMPAAKKAARAAGRKAGRKAAKKAAKKAVEKAIAAAPLPDGADKTMKAAYAAATAAGAAAGKAAGHTVAKQLLDEFKKHPIFGNGTASTAAPTVAPTAPPVVTPLVAPAPAPAPFAWNKITPEYKAVENIPRVPNAGPPEPVPPSPLDALRAAMAIRANMTPDEKNILPPNVLDKVAEMAHARLGSFEPAMPCPDGGAPAPAPVEAAAPSGPPTEVVEVSMTIKNMSFTALQGSPSMMAEFVQSVKESMAEAAGPGVKPSDIKLDLHSGSVVVDGKIAPPPGVKAEDMDQNMAKGADNMGKRLVSRVAALPGIDTIALGELSATGIKVKVAMVVLPMTTVTTTTPPTRHLPKPPKCAEPPPRMTKGEARMALAPFKPPGARGKGVKTEDGGTAWPLQDGGWAFQYPDMALRMTDDGSTRIVWSKPAYSVEYDESGISYHVGQNVVHRDTNGDLTYQQPTGTMHQEGSTLVYHWCNPNVIVYQTPAGFVYYDDMGMTYRSFGKDVTHYTWSGEVLYQGEGGITKQGTDGTVTHWTDAGAVFRHPDGSVTYTPVGESTSQTLSVSDLGPDPFPGPELTPEKVMKLSAPPAAPAAAAPPAV